MKLKLLSFAHPAIHALASNYLASSTVLKPLFSGPLTLQKLIGDSKELWTMWVIATNNYCIQN